MNRDKYCGWRAPGMMVMCLFLSALMGISGQGVLVTAALAALGMVGYMVIDRADRKYHERQNAMRENGRAMALRDGPSPPLVRGPLVRQLISCPDCRGSGWSAAGRPCVCCNKEGSAAIPRGWEPSHGLQGLIPGRSARLDYKVVADLELASFERTFPCEGAPCLNLPGCKDESIRDHRCLVHPPDWDNLPEDPEDTAAAEEIASSRQHAAEYEQLAETSKFPLTSAEEMALALEYMNNRIVDGFSVPAPQTAGHDWQTVTHPSGDTCWHCCQTPFYTAEALQLHVSGPVPLRMGSTSMSSQAPIASHASSDGDRTDPAYAEHCPTCSAEPMAWCRDRRPGLMGRQCRRPHPARRRQAVRNRTGLTVFTTRLP